MVQLGFRKNRQAGMASILITMITMIVVSLIVLGFATISRREQGNTLDQQLSTQAFYAAESGIEDARNVIAAAIRTGKAVPGKTDCTNNTDGGNYTPNYPTGNATILDSAHNVSYSCLLVSPNETSLVYDGVGDQSQVIPITATQNVRQIQITWTPTSSPGGTTAQCPGSTTNTFTSTTNWTCGYGLMRMDLVPTQGTLTRTGLENGDLTAFFEPQSSSSSGQLAYTGNNGKANVVAANCGVGAYTQCSATITGLPASKSFSLRINSLYQPSNVTVVAYNGGAPLTITGTQVTIDATGNANGVLRRVQVRVPTSGSNNLLPEAAIESGSAICKRFEVSSGYFRIPGDIANPDPNNAMCQSVTSGTPPPPANCPSDFVSTSGTQLMLDCQPYRAIGFNFSPLEACWASNWSTAQMDAFFSALPKNSLARFFAPDDYSDSAAFVERIVHEADKYNVKLIIALADADTDNRCDTDDAAGNSGKTAAYYKDAIQPGSNWENWVRSVVPPLANDPGVAIWEIANEPFHAGAKLNNGVSMSTAQTYVDTAAAYIKSFDKNHLVSIAPADVAEFGGLNGMESLFKNLDVIDDHDYAWDYDSPPHTVVVNSDFPTLKQTAQALNKPFMFDEVGVEGGPSCTPSTGLSLAGRVNYLVDKKANDYLNTTGADGAGGASALDYWLYVAGGGGGCTYQNIDLNDPLMAAVKNYEFPN